RVPRRVHVSLPVDALPATSLLTVLYKACDRLVLHSFPTRRSSDLTEIIGVLLIFVGSIISVISAIGMIRFPDVYSRAHAATKTTTLAVLLVLFGAFLYFWLSELFISVRLLLGILFVFLTAPVSGHLILRASYRSNVKMAETTIEDELKDYLNEEHSQDESDQKQPEQSPLILADCSGLVILHLMSQHVFDLN